MIDINYFVGPENYESYDLRALRAVKRQVEERLQVKPGEHVLIMADFATEKEMVQAYATAVINCGGVPTIMTMPNSGWDPWPLKLTPIVQKTLENSGADAVIFCERTLLCIWGFQRPASTKNATAPFRMLQASEQTWKYHGAFDISKEEMEKYYDIARRMADIIGKGKKVKMTGKGGTDITSEIFGGGFETWNYLHSKKNPEIHSVWNWEGGGVNGCESDICVATGTAEGVVVFDGPIAHIRAHGDPVRLTVKKGKVVAVDGGRDALIFKRLRDRIQNMDQVVEIAAGLTPGWIPDGAVHAEKRGLGNVHLAVGGWYPQVLPQGFTQPTPYMHVDGTVYCGTLEIDGKKIIEEGKVLI